MMCTYNARTLASEEAIEDLRMQAKKIKYDVIGLTETRRRHLLNAVYETGLMTSLYPARRSDQKPAIK
ncbi:hypothetical protein RB195_011411 [Necator americanus]|uniref:Endonuclease/exonuclease/phosphatase domain-containing protein n=1 Tax=Necator americanus TaxID=51031 RepID=A0ABR1D4F0_NECAM